MFLFPNKTDETDFELRTIEISAFISGDMHLYQSVCIDIGKSGRIVVERRIDLHHINSAFRCNLLRRNGTDISRRETNGVPDSLAVNYLPKNGIRTTEQFVSQNNVPFLQRRADFRGRNMPLAIYIFS